MYKVDPKYFTESFKFDYENFANNPAKFNNAKEFILPNGVHLWVGHCPQSEATARNRYTTYSYSVFAEDGAELFSLDETDYGRFEIGLRRNIDMHTFNFSRGNEKEAAKNYHNLVDLIVEPLIAAAAKDPEICHHIPIALYHDRPSMGEEILTAYQEIKCNELKTMSASSDIDGFVKDVKENVADMNKAFNALERAEEVKTNFSDLFARDKNL